MPHLVTLHGSGRQFAAEEHETLLDAARRSAMALPYSCTHGTCGSCSARLIEGHVDRSGEMRPDAVPDRILLCRTRAMSDLRIAVRDAHETHALPRRDVRAMVAHKHVVADDIVELRLHPESADAFPRLPGQYLEILLQDGRRRAFSIANAPHADSGIELHIRHVAGGDFTAAVFADLQPGDALEIHGPLGTLVPREDSERPMLFVAGGTGFAPIKALIEHFLHIGTRRPMTLYWGGRNRDALYKDALARDWMRMHPDFGYVAVIEEASSEEGRFEENLIEDGSINDSSVDAPARRGQAHTAVIADHPDLSGHDVYLSGPPGMVTACMTAFSAAGLPESRLFRDVYGGDVSDLLDQRARRRAGIACS